MYPIKLLVIVGPTASGKSELAVKLAKKFNGEIISADSRQIYKGLNLGTGKVAGKWRVSRSKKAYFYKSVRHHLIDFVNPRQQYSVARFQRDAKKAIANISSRGKLPILCGGTGHWIDAVVYNQNIPEIKPNKKLRASLEKQSVNELFNELKKIDPRRAATIDFHNKRRLIRALEIIKATGQPIPTLIAHSLLPTYHTLWLGIQTNQADLYKKIELRLKQRLKAGMVKEVINLHSPFRVHPRKIPRVSAPLSWKRLEQFGLEYRYISLYLQKKLNYEEMVDQLSFAIKHYSKRQLTWWKRNKEIKWIHPKIKTAAKLASTFLHSKF